jgi:hypothetical protein
VASKAPLERKYSRWRQVEKMRDFRIIDDKYLLKSLTLDRERIQVSIMINQSDFNTPENINWDVVDGIVDLIMNNTTEHIDKATKFIDFLIQNCGLYDKETIEKINGFRLTGIEIKDCFGRHTMTMYSTYRLQFDFVANYHVDTYGLLYVTFMNKHVISVERIQQ